MQTNLSAQMQTGVLVLAHDHATLDLLDEVQARKWLQRERAIRQIPELLAKLSEGLAAPMKVGA